MKKKAGSQLALYPTPVTVIEAMNGEKPTWTLAAHAGIMGYDRVLVSLAAPLVMKCTVVDEYDSPGFESFICTISNTYVEGMGKHIKEVRDAKRLRRTDSGKKRRDHNSLCGAV